MEREIQLHNSRQLTTPYTRSSFIEHAIYELIRKRIAGRRKRPLRRRTKEKVVTVA